MSDIRFDGKVAIITGAGAGLGKTYALEFAKRGAKVVVNDLGGARDGSGESHNAADSVVNEIKDAGGEAVANYDNVASIDGGESIINTALDSYGGIDILVNNAGILRDRSFHKMSEEEWDSVISVHLKGSFATTRAALPHMREKGYGRIIMTTSVSGLLGNFGQSNYGAAKMGLVGMMNCLKIETAKYDIKINAVAPNAYSRMTEDVFPEQLHDKMKAEFNSPIVLYLCSEQCQDSGMIFSMGAGWFGRVSVVAAPGVCLGDTNREITPEEVRDSWSKISDLSEAKPMGSGSEIFQYMGPLIS